MIKTEMVRPVITRQFPRYNLPLEAELKMKDSDPCPGRVLDIGEGGCRILGESRPTTQYARGPSTVTLKLAAGYPGSLAGRIPHRVKGIIVSTEWIENGAENCVWKLKFGKPQPFVTDLANELRRKPLRSWHCSDYQDAIASFVERYGARCNRLTRRRVDRWLGEMPDNEKVKALALQILEVAVSRYFYSYTRCQDLARRLWKQILALPDVDFNPDKVRLFSLGRQAKSGHVALYTLRTANSVPMRICPEDPRGLSKQSLVGVEWLVFVDDFMGSGTTANTQLQWMEKHMAGRNQPPFYGKKVALGFFVGFPEEAAKQHPHLRKLGKEGALICADRLTRERDTVHSEFLIPPSKRKVYGVLRGLAEARKLYVDRRGKLLSEGYESLGALVSFHYNTPSNSLPILWSKEHKWQPPLPRHRSGQWRSLDPPSVKKVLLSDKELASITGLYCLNPRVAICGESGIGKTNLAAAAAHRLMKRRNVIWHEFARHCSVDSFLCHIGRILAERCHVEQLRDEFANGAPDARLLTVLVESFEKTKPILFLGGIDRIEDDSLRHFLVSMIRLVDGTPPEVRVVCTNRIQRDGDLVPAWLEGAGKWKTFKTTNRGNLEIRKLLKEVTAAETPKCASSVTKKVLGFSGGNPLVAWLLVSIYLKGKAKAVLGLRPPSAIMKRSLLEVAVEKLFELLDRDTQNVLLAASIFICPFNREQLKALCAVRGKADVDNCLWKLHACRAPFLVEGEEGHYEMPRPIRECVHALLETRQPKVHDRYERKTGELFASLETSEDGHKLDFLSIAHQHLMKGKDINGACSLILDQNEAFLKFGRPERLVRLLEDTLEGRAPGGKRLRKPPATDIQTRMKALRARILRRLTRHEDLKALCEEEIKRLKGACNRRKRADYHFLAARSSASTRDFKEAQRSFKRAVKEVESIPRNKKTNADWILLAKIRLRESQTDMSRGRYDKAWQRLRDGIGTLRKIPFKECAHELAVACRHVHTLLYLSGDYVHSLAWADEAMSLNESVPDKEGVAIMQHKMARAWLGLRNLEKAKHLCDRALSTLDAYSPGGRWWKPVFLRTKVRIAVEEEVPRLEEAERCISEAEAMCTASFPFSSDIERMKARISFERGDPRRIWMRHWRNALGGLCGLAPGKWIPIPRAIAVAEDRFHLSELLCDRADFDYRYYQKHKPGKAEAKETFEGKVMPRVLNLLRDSANVLRDACLELAQVQPLELLAKRALAWGDELAEVEARYRLVRIRTRKDIEEPRLIAETDEALRKLLERMGAPATGVADVDKKLNRIDALRRSVEKMLSGKIGDSQWQD